MAGDLLTFDYAKAKTLQSNIIKKKREFDRTLDDIQKSVRKTVDANWSGESQQSFLNLFTTSKKNVSDFFEKWLQDNGTLIEKTNDAKKDMEQRESAAIDAATAEIKIPVRA